MKIGVGGGGVGLWGGGGRLKCLGKFTKNFGGGGGGGGGGEGQVGGQGGCVWEN